MLLSIGLEALSSIPLPGRRSGHEIAVTPYEARFVEPPDLKCTHLKILLEHFVLTTSPCGKAISACLAKLQRLIV